MGDEVFEKSDMMRMQAFWDEEVLLGYFTYVAFTSMSNEHRCTYMWYQPDNGFLF